MTDPLPILMSPRLAALPGVRHAFFTRRGGVSQGVYDSLNVGRGSGDDPARVDENRARAAANFGLAAGALATAYQVHSAKVAVADGPWGAGTPPQADAVVTRASGLICGALAADCAPVLIVDSEARVAGAVHAGWRGALNGVVEAAVDTMISLGASPGRMAAAIGPCIGPASYEVGLEFARRFEGADPANGRFFSPARAPDKRLFDLPGFVVARLAAAGVSEAEWVGRDTFAEEDWFFSNRRAVHRGQSDYGRLLSAIALTGQ